MIIEELHIVRFCGLCDRYMTFDGGLNLLEGDNESGKSRVLSFIRFIFYGAAGDPQDEKSERALLFDEKSEKIGGSLTLSCAKGRFRVERSVDPTAKGMPQEEVRIIDLSLNSPIKGNDPAALFLGVSRELFERSLFMAQLGGRALSARDLSAAIENMLSSADESVNAAKSVDTLTARLTAIEGENGAGGAIGENDDRQKALDLRLERAREDEREEKKLRESLADDRKKIRSDRAACEECKKQVEHTDALRALDRLKKAGEALEQKKKAQRAEDVLREKYGAGEFYPDRAFTKDLSQCSDRLISEKEDLEKTVTEREKCKEELDRLPLPPSGSKGKLLSAVGECRRRASQSKIIFLVAAVVALLSVVLLVICFISGAAVGGAVFSALALAGLATAVVFFMKKSRAEQEELDRYAEFGVRNSDELDEAVEKYVELTSRRAALEKRIEDLTKREGATESAIAALRAELTAAADRWGRALPEDGDLPAFVKTAEDACEQMAAVRNAEKNADDLMKALGDFDEQRVKELLSEVENDGVSGEMNEAEYRSCQTKIKFYTQAVEGLEKRVAARDARLTELVAVMEDSGYLEDECAACRAEGEKLRETASVLRLARDTLLEAVDRIRASILPQVVSEASAFLSEASEGKYLRFAVAPDFSVRVEDASGASHALENLSGGTVELCYIALRLGVSLKLYKETEMPFFFDESFAHFDDRRKAAAFMALTGFAAAGKGQFFLLACHKRDGMLLEKIANVKKFEF
ncbi:MAG: AAA family ATPase [Clostridia bacterium]|nr:AAA family ATPase [Clostridia bacterium]